MADPETPSLENKTLTIILDIWQEILKRAEAKTAGKCMLVCKDWYFLIKSPFFITAHVHHHSLNPQNSHFFLRDFTSPPKSKEIFRFYHDNPQTPYPEAQQVIPCPFKFKEGLYCRVVGSLNGIILLSDDLFGYNYNFVLWNPLIRKCIKLPKPRIKKENSGPFMIAEGFGYDHVCDDYKVVLLCYAQDQNRLERIPPRVEVYSVKERNWRWVDAKGVEVCIPEQLWSQCCVRGFIHWVAFERRKDNGKRKALGFKANVLLRFDVAKDKFDMMMVPDALRGACPLQVEVFEYQGMLALKHLKRGASGVEHDYDLDLWVMREYGVGESWTNLVNTPIGIFIEKALYFRRNGMILLAHNVGHLLSFDPESKIRVTLDGDEKFGSYGCAFMESLVFLANESSSKKKDPMARSFIAGNGASVKEENTDSQDEQRFLIAFGSGMRRIAEVITAQMKKFRHKFF